MLLSFIIPVYNAEKYIERCVESVYHQGLNINDFEVLVVNDGSTDNTSVLLNRMKVSYSNLSVINKSNGGKVAQEILVLKLLRVTTLCLLTLMII